MKFKYFKMGETELKSVTAVEVSRQARKRVENMNLNGDLLIDQMAIKTTVKVTVTLVSAAIMTAIDAAIAAGFVDISFDDRGERLTMSATVASVRRPSPRELGGDRTKPYYNGVTLEFKER